MKKYTKKAQHILNKTLELFINNNSITYRIDEIAQYASVSKVTIFKYFKSKEGLYKEVFYYYMASEIDKLKTIVEEEISFSEKIRKYFICVQNDFNKINNDLFQQFIKEYYQNYDEFIELIFNEYLDVIINLIKQGRKEDYLRDDIRDEGIITWIKYLYSYANVSEKISKDLLTYISDIYLIFFHGFVKDEKIEQFLKEIIN
ncbi:MAG: TetR/AcrR family transcriptional regulator [Bacilli bacterium]|jgi:AcrR family transcriptional regulator|nr:TetR/AcrR family transcriptional regulator [Bacilli bacterium]